MIPSQWTQSISPRLGTHLSQVASMRRLVGVFTIQSALMDFIFSRRNLGEQSNPIQSNPMHCSHPYAVGKEGRRRPFSDSKAHPKRVRGGLTVELLRRVGDTLR